MNKLLFAKSGDQESPVTQSTTLSLDELRTITSSHKLIILGPPAEELPPLGPSEKLDGFKNIDSVVILISESEAHSLNYEKAGFYLVIGLKPADVKLGTS